MNDFQYFEPTTLEEAISRLAEYGKKAKILAGGTDLIVSMKKGLLRPECIINIKNIQGLSSISYDEKTGLHIGALATLADIASSSVIKDKAGILAQAVRQVGAGRIRNRATIGGNLCQDVKCLYYPWAHLWHMPVCHRSGGNVCYFVRGAKSCQAMSVSETAAPLIALQANVNIAGPHGGRTMPADKFIVAAGQTSLEDNEILTGIQLPDMPARSSGIYLRHSRRVLDFTMAGAAIVLTLKPGDGVCGDARICLNGAGHSPIRAEKAEALLTGNRIEDTLIEKAAEAASSEARPIGDIHGSADYKKRTIKRLTREALKQAFDMASKA